MQIEIFSLCDAATADGGKLSMLGAFDTVRTAKFPAVHPHCSIALRIRFLRIEEGEHKIKVQFMDSDGQKVLHPMESVINVNAFPGQSSVSVNFILNIQGLKFEKGGEYSIDLAVDGHHKANLPLFVKEKQTAPFPKPPGA